MTHEPDRSTDGSTDPDGARRIPEPGDQGKDVVDTQGRDIGLVTGVEGDTLSVDPHPSITEKVMSTLGWGDMDEEDLPVPPEFVNSIDDEVVLDFKRDEEFQQEAE